MEFTKKVSSLEMWFYTERKLVDTSLTSGAVAHKIPACCNVLFAFQGFHNFVPAQILITLHGNDMKLDKKIKQCVRLYAWLHFLFDDMS